MKQFIVAVALLTSLSAIASEENYELGKQHGCGTGKVDAGSWGYRAEKDVDLYVNDNYYRTGWDDGYRHCKAEADKTRRIILDNIRW